MNKINTDLKYLIGLWIILILAIIPTFAHHGNFLIDCGREAYYPTQLLLGKVLYKDIFNIYGPFAYMLNAFLFKIFSINLNILYIAGCLCAFSIVSLIYLISKQFLSKFLSFSIALFTISIGITNLNLFNFIFPYSYGMLYGITAFLASVLLILKYQKTPEKTFFLYLSSFFAGLCITSKYEFLPYLIVIIYSILKIKPLKLKEYYYTIFSILFVPVFCFGVLFIQGLSINDLTSTALAIKKMAQSSTIKYFYQTQGVYFHRKTIGFLLLNFFKTLIPLSLLLYGYKASKKIISIPAIFLAIIAIIFFVNPVTFVFLPILIAIIMILNFRKILNNVPLMILTLSSITLSLKIFWGLTVLNYGVFFASFLLITISALALELYKGLNINQKVLAMYFIILATILGYQNLSQLQYKTVPIETNKGRIFSEQYYAAATSELIDYINKNTKKTDTIAIFPEGTMINFLTQRKADNIYSSLIPLYVETFGDENITAHFKKTKPEYVIFNNWNTKDYGADYICTDYALSFCRYVVDNYTQEKVFDSGLRYTVFKKK